MGLGVVVFWTGGVWLGLAEYSIILLGYPFSFKAWVILTSSSAMAVGVEGRFLARWFKVFTTAIL